MNIHKVAWNLSNMMVRVCMGGARIIMDGRKFWTPEEHCNPNTYEALNDGDYYLEETTIDGYRNNYYLNNDEALRIIFVILNYLSDHPNAVEYIDSHGEYVELSLDYNEPKMQIELIDDIRLSDRVVDNINYIIEYDGTDVNVQLPVSGSVLSDLDSDRFKVQW